MYFKRLCGIILASAMFLAACSEDKDGSPDFEKRLQSALLAANYRDELSYISCWLPQEKQRFISNEDHSPQFIENFFDGFQKSSRLSCKVNKSYELDEKDIQSLEDRAREDYGVRLDFTKARTADVEIRLNDAAKTLTDARELTFVMYEGGWYIYGRVIDSFSFANS